MSARDEGGAVRAQFSNFRLSPDKTEVIYEGRTADQQALEVRQPVADLDVMLVLVAQVFGRAMDVCEAGPQAHRTSSLGVKPTDGGVLLALTCDHGVTRRFNLDADLAMKLGVLLPDAVRRSRLTVLS